MLDKQIKLHLNFTIKSSFFNKTVYEETLTGRPHDTSVQKATNDNENVDAV